MKTIERNIETIEEWNALLPLLVDAGYKPWQYQYHVDLPEGYHVRFWAPDRGDIVVITHSPEVYDAIEVFRRGK